MLLVLLIICKTMDDSKLKKIILSLGFMSLRTNRNLWQPQCSSVLWTTLDSKRIHGKHLHENKCSVHSWASSWHGGLPKNICEKQWNIITYNLASGTKVPGALVQTEGALSSRTFLDTVQLLTLWLNQQPCNLLLRLLYTWVAGGVQLLI